MTLFDVILLLFLFGFVYGGFFNGLIKSLGAILGIIAGSWAASYFYLGLFSKIGPWFGPFDNLGRIVSFIIIFIVAGACIGFLVKVIDKAYDILSFIPFLKGMNKFAGAFLGLLQGGLIVGLLLYLFAKYSPVESFVGGLLINSKIAPALIKISKILLPFLSTALKSLQSIV